MISVRLSEEEYLALKRLCSVAGARSISDFTRESMLVLLSDGSREKALVSHISEFRSQIKKLNKKLEQLAAAIAHLNKAQNE